MILLVIGLLIWRELSTAARSRAAVAGSGTGRAAVVTGALSGALTALLVMPGPPLMVYFMRERHAPDAVRALSLSFFALCYVAVTAAQVVGGALGTGALLKVALLTPAVILGTLAGLALARHFTDWGLRMAILALLFLSGVGAIASALASPT